MQVLQLFLFSFSVLNSAQCDNWYYSPCRVAMKWGGDTPVCVCDDNYCDEYSDIPDTLIKGNKIVQISTSKAGERFQPTFSNFKRTCPRIPPPTRPRVDQNPPTTGYERWMDENANDNTNYTDKKIFLTINPDVTYQTIRGFGGAITDSTALIIQTLNPSSYDRVIKSYVGPLGSGYNFIRVPMGGCDFSVRPYTYLDLPVGDTDVKYFNLAVEDITAKIPVIKDFQKHTYRPINFLSSPWSPPVWMKNNGLIYGNGTLLPEMYQVYVNYLIKFFKTYERFGINFDYSTIQNEPSMFQDMINGNNLTPEQEIRLGKLFGKALKANGFDIKLLFADDFASEAIARAQKFLADPEIMDLVEGIAVHAYYENPNFAQSFDQIQKIVNNKIPVFNTEFCVGVFSKQASILGHWRYADIYAKLILQFLLDGGVGWLDWNLVLDMAGGPNWAENYVHGPIIIDNGSKFYKQPTFYVMAHLSKFVPEGSKRIQVTLNTPSNGKLLAFKTPDRRIVVIATNPKDYYQDLTIVDRNKGCVTVNLSPNSIHTFVYSRRIMT